MRARSALCLGGGLMGLTRTGDVPPFLRFRAISLDLWSTCLLERMGADDRLRTRRNQFLREHLRMSNGEPAPVGQIERVVEEVRSRLHAVDQDTIEMNPGALIGRVAQVLGASPALPFAELGFAYSSIGLAEDPPPPNPEAEDLIASVESRSLPVIAITNTARLEASWQEYLWAKTRLRFRHVVTSCEVGHAKPHAAIFAEAARRLGLRPAEILHVGDRWDLDARGAMDAGFGATLYSGLWNSYPDDTTAQAWKEAAARAGVLCVQRLDDPRLLNMLV